MEEEVEEQADVFILHVTMADTLLRRCVFRDQTGGPHRVGSSGGELSGSSGPWSSCRPTPPDGSTGILENQKR